MDKNMQRRTSMDRSSIDKTLNVNPATSNNNTKTKKRNLILVDSSKCSGCLICLMRCSLKFDKSFNPSEAAISINKLVNADTEFLITFKDKCDGCGICARYCPSGALINNKKEKI